MPLNITKNDNRQIAPRLGFAWRPFGDNMVVRGGYGIFYEAEGTDGRLNFNFIPFRVSETVTAAVNAVPNAHARGLLAGCSGRDVARCRSPGCRCRSRRKPGRDQRWNLGFQRQLFNLTALEVDYVGTTGDHQTAAENINLPPAGAGSVQARRPYPRFGNMSMQTQAQSSDYHALQMKLQQRPSTGSLVSRLVHLFQGDAPGAGAGDRRQLHLRTSSRSRGTSRTCSRPAMATSCRSARGAGSCRTPVRVTNAIVGGWQFQNIISYRSGLPVHADHFPRRGEHRRRRPAAEPRSARASSTIPPSTRGSTRPRSSSPPSFTFGDSGPGILRSDHQWNVDLSLFKRFDIRAGQTFEFRAEAFNVLNSVYFSGPNTNIDTAAGGRVTSTSNQARQVQFGFKYVF